MIKSMTGYGTGKASTDIGDITIEIRSVNHRHRDISLRVPSKFSSLEGIIRKEIEKVVSRGKVDAFISFDLISEESSFHVNIPLAKGYMSSLTRLKDALGLKDEIKLGDITEFKDIIRACEPAPDESSIHSMAAEAAGSALRSLDEMRINEGEALSSDIRNRLLRIKEMAESVEEKAPQISNQYMVRLNQRISELTGGMELDESRIAQEAAIIADKSDVTEETVRLKSHINQFDALLGSEEAVGRKLDFLIQEMNRETNTIGSKSCDGEVSMKVVEIKAELEKIREQVQNIE